MTTEHVAAFLLFAVVAAVTPGPSNIMLTAAGGRAGVLGGLPCLFGVATGMGLMMFLVPLGLGSLVLTHPALLRVLNWGGAVVLLWLSWKIATSSGALETTSGRVSLAGVRCRHPARAPRTSPGQNLQRGHGSASRAIDRIDHSMSEPALI